MLSQKLIATDITPAHPQDRGVNVMSLMDEFKVLHLPVVENGKLLGIVSEEDLWSMHNQEKPIKNILQRLKQAQVTFEHDVFEIVKLVNEHDLSLIPVVDKGRYMGAISIRSILKALASIVAMQSDGGVLILEMNKNDYYMSEMAQIVEGNGAKILSSYISNHRENKMLKVTLKLNVNDLKPIIQTFERYQYTITAHYDQSESNNDLHDRYDSLMRYLNT
jgi:CBS domain-containing protein